MNCRVTYSLMCALVLGSTFCLGAPIEIQSNDGTGQDGMVYAGVAKAPISSTFSVVAVSKTPTGAFDTISFAKFDLSTVGLTSAQVDSATLSVFTNTSTLVHSSNLDPDAAHPLEVAVARVTSSWDRNSLTFSNAPTFGATEGLFDVDAVGEWFSLDITDMVKDWLDTPSSNFGVRLSATTVMGSGPNGDQSPFYAAAFDSGFISAGDGGGLSETGPLLTINPVPEPTAMVLALCGVPALAWGAARARRRRCRARS
jgi:hypothetical protein